MSRAVPTGMIGRSFGRFTIDARLGQGGMSSVWRAEDALLHRPVALKVLAPELAGSSRARSRFLGEARIMAGLTHPSIPVVYDTGETDEHAWIALTLVDGESLRQRIARGVLEIDEALEWSLATARALAHAHEHRYLHRDVTSGNVMKAADGRIFLLDFGLAAAVGGTHFTSTGAMLGTPGHVAPEVLTGRAHSAASDLYALGILLFESLTGSLPYHAEGASALHFASIHADTPRLRELRPEAPEWLEHVVARATARDPGARFASAGDLAEDLAHRRSRLGPFRPARRRSAATRTTLAAHRTVAIAPFRELAADLPAEATPLTAGLVDGLAAALADLPRLRVLAPGTLEAPGPEAPPLERARRHGATLVLSGTVRRQGAQVRVTFSLVDAVRGTQVDGDTLDGFAAEWFALEDRLRDRVRRALGAGSGARPRSDSRVGLVASGERHRQALGYLQRTDSEASIDGAIRILEELMDAQPDSAELAAGYARACLRKARLTSEAEWEMRALRALERARAADPDSPEVCLTLGEVHRAAGRHDEAEASYRRALEAHPESLDAWLGLAHAHHDLGRHDRALEACDHAIALAPDSWRGRALRASLRFRRGQYAQALADSLEVTRLSPDNPQGYSNLGGMYFRLDRFEEALAAYRRSLQIRPTAAGWTSLGAVHYYLGEHLEAAGAFERAAGLKPADPMMWGNLGSAQRWIRGREAAARESFEHAIGLMRAQLDRGARDPDRVSWLAAWLANLGRDAESLELAEEALRAGEDDVERLARLASCFSAAGARARGLRLLERAIARGYGVGALRRDPEWQWLRDDPAGAALLGAGESSSVTTEAPAPDTALPRG